jgi:TetR/AcrR family transcriptional regulator
MRGAPMIQDFLDTTLTEWVISRERVVRRWVAAGKLKPIDPRFLFYMIWAATQQYANAAHEIATLNGGPPLDDKAFERAKAQVIEIILRGVAAG